VTPAQRRLIAAKMPEDRGPDSLEAHLRRLLDKYGLYGHHERNSATAIGKGWVDWTILGPGGAIFAELKSETGTASSEQKKVGYMLKRVGLRYVIWRPGDYLAGRIEQALIEIAGVQGELWEAS
jgi:hypothetical protein